mmetsp:Transcript_6828/g.11653  ORF Transcript_6828/g.11653 Transcript_6828/m.11653 type:complete len:607 (+) Transcript_6828:115-1935(+)
MMALASCLIFLVTFLLSPGLLSGSEYNNHDGLGKYFELENESSKRFDSAEALLLENINQWSFIEDQLADSPVVTMALPEIHMPVKHLASNLEKLSYHYAVRGMYPEAADLMERACPLLELLPVTVSHGAAGTPSRGAGCFQMLSQVYDKLGRGYDSSFAELRAPYEHIVRAVPISILDVDLPQDPLDSPYIYDFQLQRGPHGQRPKMPGQQRTNTIPRNRSSSSGLFVLTWAFVGIGCIIWVCSAHVSQVSKYLISSKNKRTIPASARARLARVQQNKHQLGTSAQQAPKHVVTVSKSTPSAPVPTNTSMPSDNPSRRAERKQRRAARAVVRQLAPAPTVDAEPTPAEIMEKKLQQQKMESLLAEEEKMIMEKGQRLRQVRDKLRRQAPKPAKKVTGALTEDQQDSTAQEDCCNSAAASAWTEHDLQACDEKTLSIMPPQDDDAASISDISLPEGLCSKQDTAEPVLPTVPEQENVIGESRFVGSLFSPSPEDAGAAFAGLKWLGTENVSVHMRVKCMAVAPSIVKSLKIISSALPGAGEVELAQGPLSCWEVQLPIPSDLNSDFTYHYAMELKNGCTIEEKVPRALNIVEHAALLIPQEDVFNFE